MADVIPHKSHATFETHACYVCPRNLNAHIGCATELMGHMAPRGLMALLGPMELAGTMGAKERKELMACCCAFLAA